jgi:transcriptional regulator with GAF, ATPase, and Fis domain
LIKINCANLPSTLIESILFGHEKGAFTNADSLKMGRFELADGSSIFLDEIAELPLELQSKLLRVIDEGEFERLGGSKTIRVDTRIIAATNRNLEAEVASGRFRQDLLFRLNVYPITCPPLRRRKKDIALLTHFFISKYNKSLGKSVSKISNKALQALEGYPWPGNIRELQNVIERGMINSGGRNLSLSGFSVSAASARATSEVVKTLKEMEIDYIFSVLKEADWVIEGQKGAARLLGMNPSTLRARMRKYGIRRPGVVPQF